jgi:hypothetical protein
MIILKEPIKLSQADFDEMTSVKKKMLLSDKSGMLFIIVDFKTEIKQTTTVTRKIFSANVVNTESNHCLTEIELWGYSIENEYWGTLYEEGVKQFFYIHNLQKLRMNYKKRIKLPIEKLGFEIKRKEEVKEELKQ